jgi:hypothetical protein
MNSAAKTIPMVGPTLSRFVRTLIARDDEGGMMSVYGQPGWGDWRGSVEGG